MSRWQVLFNGIWPHRNQAVTKYGLVCDCQRLDIQTANKLLASQSIIDTYLIIRNYESGNSIPQPITRKLSRSLNLLDYSIKVCLLFSLLVTCWWLHHLSDWPRYCPMVFWYICCFAPFLVQVIVLLYMMAASGVGTSKKCLSLAIQLYKFHVMPNMIF